MGWGRESWAMREDGAEDQDSRVLGVRELAPELLGEWEAED